MSYCTPLQSLSVIAMDSEFALCEISLEFISKLWTSNKWVCFGLNALKGCIFIVNPIHANHPVPTGNGSRILTRRSTVVSSLADLQLSPLKREADKWLNIYGGVGVVLCAMVSLVSSCHIAEAWIHLSFFNKHAQCGITSAKMMCSGLVCGNLSITQSYFPIIGCK